MTARLRHFAPALFLALALAAGAFPAAAADSTAVEFAGAGVVRGDLGQAEGAPLAWARAALADWAGRLGVDAGSFAFETVRTSRVGVHVRGREHRGGVPVDGTAVAVHAVRGRVVQVEARGLGGLPGGPAARAVPRSAAVAAALAAAGLRGVPTAPAWAGGVDLTPRAERLLVAGAGRLVDVWRVDVLSLAPPRSLQLDVDAAGGRPRAVRDPRVFVDGSATVFDPNPVVTAQNTGLREPGVDMFGVDTDLDSEELTAELVRRPLPQLDETQLAAGRLLGPWVDVRGPAPMVGLDGANFSFTRMDPRFEATMVYAHLDRVQRYFQSLGFVGESGILQKPQLALAVPIPGFDNSFYQDSFKLLAFGTGGVDDAEDAEVILHEYGHAVHYDQVPNWGRTHEGGAMGEGFGDFLAATYYAREQSAGFGDACIADWDAVSYSSANPPCLRRLDRDKTYPQDMAGSVHADGELWSALLWRLRAKLHEPDEEPTPIELSDNVLTLLLTSHEFLTSQAQFGDAVAALRTAAHALGRPEWVPLVNEAAAAANMPLDPTG